MRPNLDLVAGRRRAHWHAACRPSRRNGRTGGNDGVTPAPIVGLVYRPEDNPIWTYGFGLFPVAGFSVNYPAARNNPVLSAQPPYGMGLGPLSSLVPASPTGSPQWPARLRTRLPMGLAANVDLSWLSISPGVFGEPAVVSTPLGPAGNYGPATAGRYRWGGGFSVGAYYDPGGDWKFGASVKSPQWFDTFSYNSINFNGHAHPTHVRPQFPARRIGGHLAYSGIDALLVTSFDLHFLDFRSLRTGSSMSVSTETGPWLSVGLAECFLASTPASRCQLIE